MSIKFKNPRLDKDDIKRFGLTETDPIFTASPSYSITSSDISTWNSALQQADGDNRYLQLTGGNLTGNLGIGVSTPTYSLDVNGTINSGNSTSTGNYVRVEGSATDNSYDVFYGKRKYPRIRLVDSKGGENNNFDIWNLGNQLRFGTNGGSSEVASFYIKGGVRGDAVFNGNVTIAKSSVNKKLTVHGTAEFTNSNVKLKVESGRVVVENNYLFASYQGGVSFYAYQSVFRGLIRSDSSGGSALKLGDTTERMRIVAGKVGINTVDPLSHLHVNGNIRVQNSGRLYLWAAHDVNYISYNRWQSSSSSGMVIQNQGGDLSLMRGTGEYIRLTSDCTYINSNVGIGTASPIASYDKTLHIKGVNPTIRIETNNSSGWAYNQYISPEGSWSVGIDEAERYVIAKHTTLSNGHKKFLIDTNGNVGIGTTSPTHKLDVNGNANFTGIVEADSGILSRNKIQISQGRLWELIGDTSGFTIKDGSANQTRFFINTSGNADISGRLDVAADLRLRGGDNLDQGVARLYVDNSDILHIDAGNDGNNVVKFDRSGDVLINAGAKLRTTNNAFNYIIPYRGSDASMLFRMGHSTVGRFGFLNNSNTEVFTIDPRNERVGIGTISPSDTLHLYDTEAKINFQSSHGRTSSIQQGGGYFSIIADNANGVAINYGASNGGKFTLFNYTTASIKLNSNGESYFNGGNVGINKTNPTSRLHVEGEVTFGELNFEDGAYHGIRFRTADHANKWKIGHNQSANRFYIFDYTKGGSIFEARPNGNIFFTPTGNFGIGTDSPNDKLEVNGGVGIMGSTNRGIRLHPIDQGIEFKGITNTPKLVLEASTSTQRRLEMQVGSGGSFIGFGGTSNVGLSFYDTQASNAVRMRIDSNGNVGIGTTTPSGKLHIRTTTGNVAALRFTSAVTNDLSFNHYGGYSTLRDHALGNNRMLFFDSGKIAMPYNLGIGHSGGTQPVDTLDVNGTFRTNAIWSTSSAVTLWGVGSSKNAYGGLTWGAGYATVYSTSGNHLHLAASGATPDMTINTSGNVGIGTSTPSNKLHVVGITESAGFVNNDVTFKKSFSLGNILTGSYKAVGQLDFGTVFQHHFKVTISSFGVIKEYDFHGYQNSLGKYFKGHKRETNRYENVEVIVETVRNGVNEIIGVKIGVANNSTTQHDFVFTVTVECMSEFDSWTDFSHSEPITAENISLVRYQDLGGDTAFVDQQNKRVGIGTHNPQSNLHVDGVTIMDTTGSDALKIQRSGTTRVMSNASGNNGGFVYTGNTGNRFSVGAVGNNFVIQDASYLGDPNGPERMRVSSNGAVSIGTTSDSHGLVVSTAPSNGRVARLGYLEITTQSASYTGSSIVVTGSNSHISYVSTLGHKFVTRTQGGGNTLEALTISPDTGNVGVGATSPVDKLHVQGKIRIQRTGYSAQYSTISQELGNLSFNTQNQSYRFFVTGVQKMILTSQGKLGLNSFSPNALFESTPQDASIDSILIGRRDNGSYWRFNHAGNDLRIFNTSGLGHDILLGLDAGSNVIQNKVGIGTAVPQEKLHVEGNIRLANDSGIYVFTDSINTNAAEDIFKLRSSNGAQAFRVSFVCNTGGYSVAKTYEVVHSYGAAPVYFKVVDSGPYNGHDFDLEFLDDDNEGIIARLTNNSGGINAAITTTVFLAGSPTNIIVTEL